MAGRSRDVSGGDKPDSSAEFLEQAYDLKNTDEALQFYSTWAQQYDDQMEGALKYVAPAVIAQHLANVLDDRTGPVLDIGCGTGLTAQYLYELGFTVMDGLDLSKPMLQQARNRGIYRDLINADLTATLNLAEGSYSAAISSGTFTVGHVGPEPIVQIFHSLRPSGYFAFSVHRTVWREKGFDTVLEGMQASNEIAQITMQDGVFFEGTEPTAKYCVYQKISY